MEEEAPKPPMNALERNTHALLLQLQTMKHGKPSDERRLFNIVKNRQYIWHRMQGKLNGQ